MILSDFLSRQNNDDSNPNEIIPISFDMYKILESSLNSFDKNNNFGNSKYLIQMHVLKPKPVVQNSWKFMEYKKD